jgi:hypothetical protein
MNSKRRADLQRKLSMGAVPRPPANLADRIKADIPKYLQAQDERERAAWSTGFALRVAASIILLITTAFVTLNIMQPETQRSKSAARRRPVPAVLRATPEQMAEAPPAAMQASDEVRLDIFQDTAAAPAAAAAPVATDRQRRDLVAANEAGAGAEGGVTGAAADSVMTEPVREERPLQIAEMAPAPAPPPPPPAAEAVAPAPAPEAVSATARTHAGNMTVQASAPSLVREAYAKELDLQQKKSLFGISVDPEAFHGVRTSLESGGRPAADGINVEALVNYFAGAPSRAPKSGVALEVEASPAPVATEGDRAILRFTIDTPRVEVANRASVPPAAQNVRIEIDVDANAVERFRRIGGNDALIAEPTLLHNSSVTGLYEIELKPRLKSSQHVATVRLRYRSLADGEEKTVTRIVHANDVAKAWSRASRRHRLASLGAVWSESLKGTPVDLEVAERAQELAKQNPKDARAKDLADAVSAWGGGAP